MAKQLAGRIAVVGLGNRNLSDDGIGEHALRVLKEYEPDGVHLISAGTSVMEVVQKLRGMDRVLVIDAVRGGGSPGTVYFIQNGNPTTRTYLSMHALGLRLALRMLPPRERPQNWMILGVEPARRDYGRELSPELRLLLPGIVRRTNRLIARWADEQAGHTVDATRSEQPFRQSFSMV